MRQANRLNLTGMIFRGVSALLCMILILAFCGCQSADTSSKPKQEDKAPVSNENSAAGDTSEEIVAHPVAGEITVTGSIEPAKLAEKSFQLQTANPSASIKGYAENETQALRKEILNTPNTSDIYNITGTKYYISPNGDDNNSGLSEKDAFASIDALEMIDLQKGDAILLERGYVYRFGRTIAVKSGITYGSYGTGNKPAVYGSPINGINCNWTPTKKKNVWQTDFSYERACGMFLNYGEIAGILKNTGIGALEKNGDFYHDYANGLFYMYCDTGNPAKIYKSIEITPSFSIFRLSGVNDVVIDNLSIKYGSYGVSSGKIKNVHVTNCEFGYIGGMVGADVRRGNAIEIFPGPIENIYFEHNWIYQTFDSAVTWQGNAGEDCLYKNVSFSKNLLEYNNADFEFWESDGAVIDGFVMNNNIMRFTSMGWGTRPEDGGIREIEGCFKGDVTNLKLADSIDIKNNIIDCPAREIVSLRAKVEQRHLFKTSGNKVYVKAAYRSTEDIVEFFPNRVAISDILKAKNLAELKTAFERFDENAELNWYE